MEEQNATEGCAVDPSAAEDPAPESADDQGLRWLIDSLVAAAELRDWAAIADRIESSEVFVWGEFRQVADLVPSLDSFFAEVCDLELQHEVLEQRTVRPHVVRTTVGLRVVWSSTVDWDEHFLELVVHVSVEQTRAEWRILDILVERALEPVVPDPPVRAPAPGAMPDPVPPAPALSAPEQAALYFAEAPSPPAKPERREIGDEAELRRHMVYVPVFLSGDALRELMGK